MFQEYADLLKDWLLNIGLSAKFSSIINMLILATFVAIISIFFNFLAKFFIRKIVKKIITHSKNSWDDIIYEKKVFNNLSHLAPVIIIYYFTEMVLTDFPKYIPFFRNLTYIYIIIISFKTLFSFLNALNDIYNTLPAATNKNRSIKGYVQGFKIVMYIFEAILIFSVLFDKSPLYFLTGMGAVAAVLMLVFKDSILGLVAGIQLSANDMVRLGDWITMNSKGADGTVIDISLHTVKVQNWDKTICSIPTYSLVSESFNNWRGMEESGGRRIKRSINIDMKSIKLLNKELYEKLLKVHIISDYLQTKRAEVEKYNELNKIDTTLDINGRRLTNIGTFRKYIEFYLQNNPFLHPEMTTIVRQLQPTETGLPIEIYTFSKIQSWAEYEAIQSDIFDHILAVISDFELRVFQNPTGDDFKKFIS